MIRQHLFNVNAAFLNIETFMIVLLVSDDIKLITLARKRIFCTFKKLNFLLSIRANMCK